MGLVLGYLGSYAIKSINDYKVTVMITVALVMGGYLIARYLHERGAAGEQGAVAVDSDGGELEGEGEGGEVDDGPALSTSA